MAVLLICAALMPGVAAAGEDLPVRGVVRAQNLAAISVDFSSRIARLPLRRGEAFNAGDVLVEFDCTDIEAERDVLVAEREVQRLTLENNRLLRQHKAIGKYDVDISQAQLDKADATIRRIDVRLQKCIIRAPFEGAVDEVLVREHETPAPGAAILRLTGTRELEVELIVPSTWTRWLKAGTGFDFIVEETAETHEAEVVRLGASVDPVSQTIVVIARLRDGAGHIRPGMSGSARFAVPQG